MESAVLQRTLDVHPTRLTLAELTRELVGEEADFGSTDSVERAARELSAVGLVHLLRGVVEPTRAALKFAELLDR